MATANGKVPGLSNIVLLAHPWFQSEGWGVEVATTAIANGQIVKKTGSTWAAITAVLPLVT